MAEFNPRSKSNAACRQRIADVASKLGPGALEGIVVSTDKSAVAALKALETKNVPAGFAKFQLPVSFGKDAFFFVSTAAPNATVPKHSHSGDGIRFMVSGSVTYKGKELKAGDWMFIPKDAEYELQVGPLGATMAYCYAC